MSEKKTKETPEDRFKKKLETVRAKIEGMTHLQKLKYLDELLAENYIEALFTGSLGTNELGAIVTYLKNNKVVQEKKEESEADVIDGLVEEKN